MPSITSIISAASLLAFIPGALAGYNPSSTNNVAIYWGQNSINQGTGPNAQQRLSHYCANSEIDIIPLGFLLALNNPLLNLANAGDNCTAISGSQLFSCPQLAEDIPACQALGKTIMLSIGGAGYSEGGFSSSSAAVTSANNIWKLFGPVTAGATRPFGNAVVDGFDFDFESTVSNMQPFASQLRSLMDSATNAGGKKYYLSAAPQCPYPDAADDQMLNGGVFFDFIYVQFYNNYCAVNSFVAGASTQNNFNFATWDNWAKTGSANKNVKVFLGAPGNTGAANGGQYVSAATLGPIISYSKQFSSFGGVMFWDMSQVYANSGFLDTVVSELGGSNPPPPPTSTRTTTTTRTTGQPTTFSTTTRPTTTTGSPPSTTGLPQWAQCGGNGYTGPTTCASPFKCVVVSEWWSQCE
ncbi:glycoside hydrolase family 18 protein [Xylogone sp. PMI_703]|nr:glycoside hydrolase family 18 protein [Xylogone sp. PMI_703]